MLSCPLNDLSSDKVNENINVGGRNLKFNISIPRLSILILFPLMGMNCPNISLISMQNVSSHKVSKKKMYTVKYDNKCELFKKKKKMNVIRLTMSSRCFLRKPRKHLYLSSFPSLSPAWLVTRLIHDWPSFARRFDLSILLHEKRGKVWWCNRDEFRSGTRPEARWQKGRSTLVVTHARTVYAPPLGR